MTNEQSDLAVAVEAARAGAEVLQRMYGSDLTREHKSTTDFATEADSAAERAILEVIRAARPEDGFVGEELGSVGDTSGSRVWLVDPLCGTLNFASVTPLYCVNVALNVDGVTVTAAVSHPPSGELYWAHHDEFGTSRARSAPPTTLVAINADGPLDRPFVGAQLAADPELRARFDPRIESTTLALAWVASGHRLGYVTDGFLRGSVHFEAGIALCRAAGRVVTDFDGNDVHSGPGLVAAGDADAHAELLRLVSRHRADHDPA